MDIHELVIEMKLLERRLTLYEEKYGILSEDFYAALMSGKLARYDEYDETRADFSRWKGIYETWLRRKQAYTAQLQQRELVDRLSPPQARSAGHQTASHPRARDEFHPTQSTCAHSWDRGPGRESRELTEPPLSPSSSTWRGRIPAAWVGGVCSCPHPCSCPLLCPSSP